MYKTGLISIISLLSTVSSVTVQVKYVSMYIISLPFYFVKLALISVKRFQTFQLLSHSKCDMDAALWSNALYCSSLLRPNCMILPTIKH